MRVLVCGSRDWTDWAVLRDVLDRIAGILRVDIVIEGEQRGADVMAREWAELRGITFDPYPAEWARYGRMRAGGIRNRRMLTEGKPDLVVAFPLPTSRGTWDMVNIARRAGIKTWVYPECMAEVDALGEGVFV